MRSYEERETIVSASISKNCKLQITTKMFNHRYLVPKKSQTRKIQIITMPNHNPRKGPTCTMEYLHKRPDRNRSGCVNWIELFYIDWVLQVKIVMIYSILFFVLFLIMKQIRSEM